MTKTSKLGYTSDTNACACARTHAHVHARTHTRTHGRTHARTHAHTHACTHARRLQRRMESLGMLEDTVFVVMGDHGEAFGDFHEKNYLHKASRATRRHRRRPAPSARADTSFFGRPRRERCQTMPPRMPDGCLRACMSVHMSGHVSGHMSLHTRGPTTTMPFGDSHTRRTTGTRPYSGYI